MKIITKNFLVNIGFGIPAGNNVDGRCQIGPVICTAVAMARSGGWVFQNGNNSLSNCASNCANNCANNAQNNRGFRRALFASPILDYQIGGNRFAVLGGSMQTIDRHKKEAKITESADGENASSRHATRGNHPMARFTSAPRVAIVHNLTF